MSKLVWLVVLAAAAAGAGFAAYNTVHYETPQPFPLAWNHSADELDLLDLEHLRRQLLAKLGSAQRVATIGGLHLPLEATGGHLDELRVELGKLDARIEALRVKIGAAPGTAR